MTTLSAQAPGKLNLCLHLGPTRADGLHELASIFESVSLADKLTANIGVGTSDRVICPGIEGENLAGRALATARDAGLLAAPPVELTIEKRIPVAAGMGGGSADAACTLRLAAEIERRPIDDYRSIAFELGADVPSQLTPGAALVFGAGERVSAIDPEILGPADRRHYVIVGQQHGLSTAEVFAQADRAGLCDPSIVDREETLLERTVSPVTFDGLTSLVENALTPAILALRPELAALPALLRKHGAAAAEFTGSGPTCFGVFADAALARAAEAALRLAGHEAWYASAVGREFAAVATSEEAR